MSEYTFTYGGNEFKVSWGMLFQRAFWDAGIRLGADFDAVEMLALCIFKGNAAYHNLNGGLPAFKTKGEVYQLIEATAGTEQGQKEEGEIIAAFVQTQAYKSLLPGEESTEKKNIDFDDIKRHAFGSLGLKPDEFYRMTFADYAATCDGVELEKQKRLSIQRFFISAILSTQSTKRIAPEDVLYLSIFDKTDKEKGKELINRLFEKELKRKKNGSGSGTKG